MDPRSQVENIKMQMISDRLRTKALSAATLAGAIAITALLAPHTVRAGEYCSRDVDFMNNCSFSSMEQCKASVSGTDGECCPNPSSKHTSIVEHQPQRLRLFASADPWRAHSKRLGHQYEELAQTLAT